MASTACLPHAECNPFGGHLFILRGRRGDMIKMLWADEDGLCLFVKRLELGRFVWPAISDGKIHLTPAQRAMLLQQQTQLRTYAGQVDGYEREIERLKAQLDKLRSMLFGHTSEKKGRKLEKKIHEAEKRLAEMETRLGAAKQCLESAAAAVVASDTTIHPKRRQSLLSPQVAPHRENRFRHRCRVRHGVSYRRKRSALPAVAGWQR